MLRQEAHDKQIDFSEKFKRDAVRQITERGYPVAEVSQRLGASLHSLYEEKKFSCASGNQGSA
ncbi:transposase [Agrobacterium vitis]|nr:transposase [Agrobacterium vitis]MUO73125.1 transposase [Agrobacterium vitis]MUO86358.1 transposase [Agrobacterium vitis]